MTQKITPFLWFDGRAEEATNFYVSIFKNSEVLSVSRYGDAGPGPAGAVMATSFRLSGLEFMALNGGPEFKFTPAISFFVSCENEQEVDEIWAKLSDGGSVLMGLDKYPFSDKFGWVMDTFGVSWQVSLAGVTQRIAPFFMFVGTQHGRAEEAMNVYTSLFKNSKIVQIKRYGTGEQEPEGTVKHATFSLDAQEFMAIDSNWEHPFTFTPAISFFTTCETQREIDELWDKLSEGGATGRCGWLSDRFGVSWQVVPSVLGDLLQDEDRTKSNKVMQAMLQMTKLDMATLRRAHEQE